MMSDLRDAKRALGLGFSLLVYAAWLWFDHRSRSRRIAESTRANLAYDNAQTRRGELMRQEGIEA